MPLKTATLLTALFLSTIIPLQGDAQSISRKRKTAQQTDVPSALTGKNLRDEIVQTLQTSYVNPSALTSEKLARAAADGILGILHGSAILLDSADATRPSSSGQPSPNNVTVISPFIGYMRLDAFQSDSPSRLATEMDNLVHGQHASGLILDLRFARNDHYAAVPALASVLIPANRELYTIQRGSATQSARSVDVPNPVLDTPLVILINHNTRGAPELLAAVLQSQGRALLMGSSSSAGHIYETSDVKLSNGQILRLASGKFVLPSSKGGDLFLKSISPDVKIPFDSATEQEICSKPFQAPEIIPEPRFYSEAILTGRDPAPPLNKDKLQKEPTVPNGNRDLVLLHAMDLIKSIRTLDLSSTSPSPHGNQKY